MRKSNDHGARGRAALRVWRNSRSRRLLAWSAVLLAALCRSAGIPARVAAGLVYLRGRFYYHAWNELYLNEWVAVDATLGQFPADVTHIKFIEGDMEDQVKVLNLIGKLKIEVVDYK